MKRVDVIGATYGRLTVKAEAEPKQMKDRKVRRMLCECTCGETTTVFLTALRNGTTTSCGCYRKEATGDFARSHGESNTKLYYVWKTMKQRCTDPTNDYYYGRGITVCDEWQDYEAFASWAKTNGYAEGLTIERRNNDLNYSPSNCVWATWVEQANNRRPRS